MKRVVKLINDNRYKVILGSFLVAFLLVFLISYSFAATVPVESVEIKSENLDYDKNDPGSWKITKSAHWISKGKARITFEVNTIEKNYDRNRDIIFVVDSSASMYNGEFDQIKKDIASVLTLLKKDTKTNRVALIDFNDEARVLSNFTTDLDSISTLVNNIVPDGNTNYYQALVKVDDVLTNYKYDSSKNVSVVFLTDGFPNVDMPNEKTQYAYLKSQYSYLNVKAIQYGETEVVLSYVKGISDKQYLANKDNIENIFHRAMFGAIEYDNFQITDNINSLYFSAEKAEASLGNVDVTDGKVVWNITDSVFDSGDSTKLTIDITLKNSIGNVSLYETNSSESILYKIDSTEENINSSKTPVLASSYTVSYLGNAPAGCSVTNVPVAKKYSVFDTVGISSDIPVCFGYQFKGWKIVTKNVEKIGDNSFVMPGFDIELKATWSKLSLNKSSTGTISESATLYKVIKNEAESGGLAKEYTGEHQDS
ncbi:MAG: VWA domain-containing protein, partial [bacterium]|nr:VWA domain-containing protein [bacterium]